MSRRGAGPEAGRVCLGAMLGLFQSAGAAFCCAAPDCCARIPLLEMRQPNRMAAAKRADLSNLFDILANLSRAETSAARKQRRAFLDLLDRPYCLEESDGFCPSTSGPNIPGIRVPNVWPFASTTCMTRPMGWPFLTGCNVTVT